MATLNINGRKVTVDDSFLSLSPDQQNATVEEIAGSLGPSQAQPQQSTPKTDRLPDDPAKTAEAERNKYYSSGIYAGEYNPLGPIAKSIDAFSSGAQRAPLFGWDDEAVAAGRSLAGNVSYSEAQKQEDAKKAVMRSQNPVASTIGELSGGLATGGTIASTGATLAGRSLPVIGRTGAAGLEGAAYGALNLAGEAKQGERLKGAALGALVGGPIGMFGSTVADKLAASAARKTSSAAAPSIDDLTATAQNLYQQADQAQVVLKPQTTDRLINNMTVAAGRPNDKLRPNTLGIVEDVQALRGKPISLSEFHELRQEINLAMKNAQPQDERTLMRMKTILDAVADNATTSDVTGNVQGFKLFKEANSVWAKKAKAQKIEDLFDLADVKSAKYSQSGMQNAIRDKASQLYTQIVKGKEKGFSGEEIALIRQLSKGEMTPTLVNWLGKFAPRGVVSAGFGSGLGAAIGSMLGPAGAIAGAATPGAIGFGAAKIADRAAVQGLNALRDAAAKGASPVLGAITNKGVPFIGAASGGLANLVGR